MPGFDAVTALVLHLQGSGRDLPCALRVARQLVLERLAVLDIEQRAPLSTITGSMTHLAEATLELALAQAQLEADERHGPALNAQGQRVDFWIVGMGKLGARELNVSSDIDLIYVYEADGQTAGAAGGTLAVSFHEYFAFVAKRLYALIGDTTDDGFVFRVDLALRPNGNSGPPVVSLAMLEEYLQVQHQRGDGVEARHAGWQQVQLSRIAPAHTLHEAAVRGVGRQRGGFSGCGSHGAGC